MDYRLILDGRVLTETIDESDFPVLLEEMLAQGTIFLEDLERVEIAVIVPALLRADSSGNIFIHLPELQET